MELVCVANMRLLKNCGENPQHLHRMCYEEFSFEEYFDCEAARLISSAQTSIHLHRRAGAESRCFQEQPGWVF